MSNIKEVYAMINGQKVVATYNEGTQTYTVQTSAPSKSSWSQPGHVYKVSLHASDAAGNDVVMTSDDKTYGDELKIRVLEKTKPTATITSPTQNSVLGSATQNITMEMQDAGGSGLNMETVVFKVNGSIIPNSSLSWSDSGSKKTCTYRATGLSDGSNTVSLQVTDNDGNVSETDTVTFIISTAAPNLTVTTPTEGLITNDSTIDVTGNATPGSDAVTITKLTVNGEAAEITPEGGNFSKNISLTEGSNTITVVATDSIGKTTTVTRHVTLDTKAPVITDVVAVATTVNVGGTIKITFKVTDPS